MEIYGTEVRTVSRWQHFRERVAMDGTALATGRARLVDGVRFLLFACTALWVPVLCLPGDTMAGSLAYATIRTVARWLGLPPVDGILSPGELLLAAAALFLTLFSVVDYLTAGGSHFPTARVYLASMFWIGLAAAYLLANPLAYGTWLFVGFALTSVWCLRVLRRGEGRDVNGG